MLLQVVAFARDVRGHFDAVREPHAGHLAEGRVRLLRGHRLDDGADAALLRAALHGRVLRLGPLRLAAGLSINWLIVGIRQILLGRPAGSPDGNTYVTGPASAREAPAAEFGERPRVSAAEASNTSAR